MENLSSLLAEILGQELLSAWVVPVMHLDWKVLGRSWSRLRPPKESWHDHPEKSHPP